MPKSYLAALAAAVAASTLFATDSEPSRQWLVSASLAPRDSAAVICGGSDEGGEQINFGGGGEEGDSTVEFGGGDEGGEHTEFRSGGDDDHTGVDFGGGERGEEHVEFVGGGEEGHEGVEFSGQEKGNEHGGVEFSVAFGLDGVLRFNGEPVAGYDPDVIHTVTVVLAESGGQWEARITVEGGGAKHLLACSLDSAPAWVRARAGKIVSFDARRAQG